MRYFVKLAYNGTPFFGWQIQPDQISVQAVLENAFSLLLRSEIKLTGCGRTDTGVHAREFYAHFDFPELLPDENIRHLIFRLNSFLPKEIVIYRILAMHGTAHARFDATARTYRYYIDTEKDPFRFCFSYRVYDSLNIEIMNEAAQILIPYRDFKSFSKVRTQVNNFNCRIAAASWYVENRQLVFEITADRFLRNMVRAIVGTHLEIGKGRMSLTEFKEAIEAGNRSRAGISVPAHALFLEKIRYPDSFGL